MAENGKNRLAIFTIFRLRRTDVKLVFNEYALIENRGKASSKYLDSKTLYSLSIW